MNEINHKQSNSACKHSYYKDLEIRQVSKDNPDIQVFRKKLLADISGVPDLIDRSLNRKEIYEAFKRESYEKHELEEIYKFSDVKWFKTQFTELLAGYVGKNIATVSGSEIHKDWLRIGMHHHLLSEYRKSHRSPFFRFDGFMHHHLKAAEKLNLSGVFFSIYPYNSKLRNYIDFIHSKKKLSSVIPLDSYMSELNFIKTPHVFNYVEQYFFYYPIKSSCTFNVLEIIND